MDALAPPEGFGPLLRHFRMAAGLSQEQLAERAALTAQGVSALERGLRQTPYPDTVRRLAAALGLTDVEYATLEATIPRARRPHTAPIPDPARVPTARHLLPTPPTPLIGRTREVAAVAALLHQEAVRCLTLTGPGGVGKTRLALQVAAELGDLFGDGVVFVALDAVRDPALVAPAIAAALDIQARDGRPVTETLHTHLRDRHLLLVLDNFEQVLAAAPLVAALLGACPRLHLLVTSRATLRVRGERTYALAPLTTPDPAALLPLADLATVPAVALLVQRARDLVSDFALDATNASAVATLCRQVDGLPLALELAAARLRVLTPQALVDRLGPRLPVLSGGARDLPARQQTLHATLAWSHDLLTAAEQTLFARLAVFAGGCTLEAVEAVCGDEAPGAGAVVEAVEGVVDQSLLRRGSDGDGVRFTMLETVRAYAAERLAQSGEEATLRARHATHFQGLAAQAAPELTGTAQLVWLARLEAEQANLRAALAWALESDNTALGLQLAGALWRFWYKRGDLREGRTWLSRFLERAETGARPVAPLVWAQALYGAAGLAWAQGDYTPATALATQSLTLYRASGAAAGVADALNVLGVVAQEQGDYTQAGRLLEEGLAVRRALGDRRGAATLLHNLGVVAREQGDYGRARALYEESLAIKRDLDDTAAIAATLDSLGEVAFLQGKHADAAALLQESLARRHALRDRLGRAVTLLNLGAVAEAQGDRARATALYEESAALARELGAAADVISPLVGLGRIACDQGQRARAAALYREGLALAVQTGSQGALAACLDGVATVSAATGEPHRAVHLYAAATTLRATLGAPLAPADQAVLAQQVASVRAAVGPVAFAAAWAAGEALPLEQAVAEAMRRTGDEPEAQAEGRDGASAPAHEAS